MSDMTTELQDLIATVESGDYASMLELSEEPQGCMPHLHLVLAANNGSLDAAKALHDEVIPGWEWKVSLSNATVWISNGKTGAPKTHGMSDIASRAWLLAILRALLVREKSRESSAS